MKKKKLVLDTNYLIYLAKEKRISKLEGLALEYECYIIDKTFKEIEGLIKGRHKQRIVLLLELLKEMLNNKKLKIIKSKSGDVDNEILRVVGRGFNVATYDKKLIKKIKNILNEKNLKIEIVKAKI